MDDSMIKKNKLYLELNHTNYVKKSIFQRNIKKILRVNKFRNFGNKTSISTVNFNNNDKLRSKQLPLADLLKKAMEIHELLYEVANMINSYFQFQLLAIMLLSFIVIVFNCFHILSLLSVDIDKRFGESGKDLKINKTDFIMLFCYQLIAYGLNILAIVFVCAFTLNTEKQIHVQVHRMLNKSTTDAVREQLMQFSMQLLHCTPVFSTFGMFPLDGTLLFTVFGATTTYLIILIQFTHPFKQDHHKTPRT